MYLQEFEEFFVLFLTDKNALCCCRSDGLTIYVKLGFALCFFSFACLCERQTTLSTAGTRTPQENTQQCQSECHNYVITFTECISEGKKKKCNHNAMSYLKQFLEAQRDREPYMHALM